ncbi:hypothetical protein J2X73_003695 [Novosphingobium sp. 1748]|uniref:ATP-binding protein n=1 Tax=Novosphingobium sp. 1748 TaxID=2817760 RepID=UPI002856B44C|nr:ATP-binding protein [Novosphingobium sp. 1748]MDR6709306.1 hypothetical protein [Novosphingobium sp. 1748]
MSSFALTQEEPMSLPASIQPQIGSSLITRVTRLYNGTILDCLHELLQNARRAGASAIEIELEDSHGIPVLTICDNGRGIDDPQNLLTLGQSGWDPVIAAREDPAGMGIFSLAGRHVSVRSWSRAAQAGWQVTVPENGWEGQMPLALEPADIKNGTQFRVSLPPAWAQGVDDAVKQAALHYPLPVLYRGEGVKREDFLAGALHVEICHGVRIGAFRSNGRPHWTVPRINFHGVTVPCGHEGVGEVDGFSFWHARVDIVDAPALQLVLPARKEMVENEALGQLRIEMEAAIYRAIAQQPGHRLSFKSWQRANELGINLPEAAAWLNGWTPRVADSPSVPAGVKVATAAMMITSGSQADLEQAAAPVIGNAALMGMQVVDAEPDFEGYGWYDRLPRITSIDFTFEYDGKSWAYGDSVTEYLPPDMPSGRVTNLMLDLSIAGEGGADTEVTVRSFAIPMLVADNEACCLDEAIILIGEGANVDPADLARLMEASLFCASDDADCDSWETQRDRFCENALNLANTLLLGEEEALIARLRAAVLEHVVWLIPQGRQMALTVSGQTLDLALLAARTFDEEADEGPGTPKAVLCGQCHGDDVLSDASVRWDKGLQNWIVSAVFDEAWCDACGDTDRLEVPIPPAAK